MQKKVLVSLCLILVAFAAGKALAGSKEETVEGLLDTIAPAMSGVISTGLLGPAGNLDGLPHFTLGIGSPIYSGSYMDPFTSESKSIFLAFPSLQGRIGIFKGWKFGVFEGVGSIDLGGKYGYIPSEMVNIFKKRPTLTGVELKVGILKDSLTTPSVSASITSNSLSGLTLGQKDWEIDFNASTFGVKVLVSKKLPLFHPYGGLGYEGCSLKARYKIDLPAPQDAIEKPWERNPSFFRVLCGCEFGILPFVTLNGEYNRLGENNIYALGLRVGL